MWQKILGFESRETTDLLFILCLPLLVVGGITGRAALFLVTGLFLVYMIAGKIYDRIIGNKLTLENNRNTIRLFPGDDAVLLLQFANKSLLPYINGRLTFHAGASITFPDLQMEDQTTRKYKLPLHIGSMGTTAARLPIHAESRGAARISNIHYQFPHLFKFHTVVLQFISFYHQEIVVYPRPLKVEGLKTIFQVAPGNQHSRLSPFENMENKIGTRDYSFSDPFYRINWKATAKMQRLQTNHFERIIDRSFIFIIHLPNSYARLERFLSYTAYLAKYALEQGFPFEIYINARRPGRLHFIHLPEGEGMTHYLQAIDMLARVHTTPITSPFAEMLHHINAQMTSAKTCMIIGDISNEANAVLRLFTTAAQITSIQEKNDTAWLLPWKKGVGLHATPGSSA